jgi:tetratricopeptide (TPR) repeat protein
MKKKDASFWSEIKSLDERLAREPDSFCFARLSTVYLKVGLISDALHTARSGVAKHPGYLSGQRALAMACNASDLHDECRVILERFTAAMPEDVEAQKVLASLYVEAGDAAAAIRTYSTVLDFRPEDVQSKTQLKALQQDGLPEPAVAATPLVESAAEVAGKATEEPALEPVEDEEILDLTEDDIVYDDELEEDEEPAAMVAVSAEPDHHDPLSTQTLAELYEQQGFITKALDIYRTILSEDPGNTSIQARIAQLEPQEASPAPVADETAVIADSAEQFTPAAFEDMPAPLASQDLAPLAHKEADNVVGTLDGWLENIRRFKACR